MKNILIFTSVVTLAVAGPHGGLVDPDAAGPCSFPDEPVVQIPEHCLIPKPEPELPDLPVRPPVVIPPPVIPPPVIPPPVILPPVIRPPVNPVAQIILNINGQQGSVPGIVVPQSPVDVAPFPVDIVDSALEPVEIGPAIVPEPVEVEPEIAPEPVEIGIPVLPYPAEVLPENLN